MRRNPAPIGARLTVVAAAALWAACASGGTEADVGPTGTSQVNGAVTVEVENNLTPSTSVTVLVDDPTEEQRVLGSVNTGITQTFALDTSNLTAGYRLIAEATDGSTIRSDPVDALGSATVTWDLEQNVLRVRPGPR